jgi:lipopolysaccharide/colanic/teichoic acid biosynthesis glycosyltransferase
MESRRIVDLIFGAAALAASAPLIAGAALAVWLEDGGHPFYGAIRVGRGGRRFRMWKLRSMRPGADRTGVCSTAADDPRITRAGAWIRRWKLDELPQLLHVVRGEMSLVGPRPQVPQDAARYTEAERGLLAVPPGVTDPASIVFADEAEILRGASDADGEYDRRIRPWKSRIALVSVAEGSLGHYLRVLAWTAAGALSRRRALECVAGWLAGAGETELAVVALRREAPPPGLPPGAVPGRAPESMGPAAAGAAP